MSVYDKNLTLLAKKNPSLAFHIMRSKESSEPNKTLSFPESTAQVLYFLGLGDEQWCRQALTWVQLSNKRCLMLLERDMKAFCGFFSLKIAEEIVNHPCIFLAAPPFEETLQSFVCSHIYQTWECFGDREVQNTITHLILQMEGMVGLYRDFGIPQIINIFSNLLASKNVRSGEAFFDRFSHVPAIICGAGFSLENHLSRLKDLENKALIFGGGSALVPLIENSIPFHFAVALDPESPQQRFFKHMHYETPLFYQNQLSHSMFSMVQGPKLCLGDNGSFPLERWLDLPLSYCDIGWNVATFATQIAYRLGCNPIIFVGMDLCVSKTGAYAGQLEERCENSIICRDRYGNSVTTRLDFFMAKQWLESFARTHPECTFLNATDSGLLLDGIKDVSLNVISSSYDLKSQIHRIITETPLLDLSHLPMKFREIEASLYRCMDSITSFREKELDSEIFHQHYLFPLWNVWKYLLQTEEIVAAMRDPVTEKRVQQVVFFKEVTERFKVAYEKNISF